MRSLKFINSNGMELDISQSAPFLLVDFDSSNNINLYSTKGMDQDGVKYLGNTLDVKDISINVAVNSGSMEEAIANRNTLNAVFNPKLGEGWLIYQDEANTRKVKCIVSALPYWDKTYVDTLQSCLISLTADNPYWNELQEIKKDIALWLGDFHFALTIPQDTGIIMGHRAPSLIVNVNNSGDVECGMKIVFKALATLTNPSLFNVNTREYIKINKSMVSGETITITTQNGNKKIIDNLNGIISNAYMYIDLDSTFLQLAVGDNLFRYNADNGIDNLECEIYYTPQYLGV